MDNALEVEPGDEKIIGHCDGCGHETRTFRGFVYDQDGAYAVYLCTYTASHPELGVDMAVSMGSWGTGNDPSLKQCVALEWRQSETGPGCRVIDASGSRWHGTDVLGMMLSREQAMTPLRRQRRLLLLMLFGRAINAWRQHSHRLTCGEHAG